MYAVYRHFDENDRLLYIGRSRDPLRRLDQHRFRAKWYRKVKKVTLDWFPTFKAAAKAEADAIRAETPEFNRMLYAIKAERQSAPRVDRQAERRAREAAMAKEYAAIMLISQILPRDEAEAFMAGDFEQWKAENADMWQWALNDAGKGLKEAKGVKAMSEQSYRNWKSKGFPGYQIPNDDDVIEANSEE